MKKDMFRISAGSNAPTGGSIRHYVAGEGIFIGYLEYSRAKIVLKNPLQNVLKLNESCLRLATSQTEVFTILNKHVEQIRQQRRLNPQRYTRIAYAAVIVDVINKPDAIEIIKKLKGVYPEIPVIAVANQFDASMEDERRAWYIFYAESGARYVLSLPASQNNIIELLSRAVKLPDENEKKILVGESYIRRKEQEGATLAETEADKLLALAESVLDSRPGYARALALRGRVYARLGDSARAVSDLSLAVRGGHLESIQVLLDIHKERSEFDQAMVILDNIRKISRHNPEHTIAQGQIALFRNNPEEADQYFQEARKKAHKIARQTESEFGTFTDVSISQYCLQANNLELANRYFNDAANKNKKVLLRHKDTLLDLGIRLCQQKRYQEAIENYKKCIASLPNDSGLYYNLAKAFFELATEQKRGQDEERSRQNFGNAREALNKAHALITEAMEKGRHYSAGGISDNLKVMLNISKMFYRLGDKSNAKAYANLASRLDPSLRGHGAGPDRAALATP